MTATLPTLPGFEVHYGLRVADVGEDGAVVILGHHRRRRAIAALNRHARTFWGAADLYDGERRGRVVAEFIFKRHAVVTETARGWELRLTTDAEAGAFPVMIWEA